MARDYFKSHEGEAAYKAINWPYPEELYDKAYDHFIKLTKNTKKEEYKHIQNMKRLVLKSGEEFIVHDIRESKKDPLGNDKSFYRGNIGKYGKPIPHWEIRVNPEEGYAKEKYVSHIDRVEDCYSIPFTQENIDKLQKYCDGTTATAYSIEKEDFKAGITVSITSLEDRREGKAEELLRFGHVASSFEKQVLEDEKIGKFQSTPSPAARAYS
jgi:hypothetical protein